MALQIDELKIPCPKKGGQGILTVPKSCSTYWFENCAMSIYPISH